MGREREAKKKHSVSIKFEQQENNVWDDDGDGNV